MNLCDFRRKFDEIAEILKEMSEFHRNDQEMTNCLEIFGKNARKIRKIPEISGIGDKFHSSFHFSNPLLKDCVVRDAAAALQGFCASSGRAPEDTYAWVHALCARGAPPARAGLEAVLRQVRAGDQ